MINNKKIAWVIFISVVFILINAFFIYKENLLLSIIPLGLLIVFAGFLYLDKLVLAVVFLAPLSVPLSKISSIEGIDMFLPTEPILFGILLIFIAKLLLDNKFDKKIIYHPVSIAIYFSLFWMLVTSLTSTMIAVSLKYLLARLWFIVAFYFIATQIFINIKNIKKYNWLYISALIIVIFYTWINLSKTGFLDQKAAHVAASPFYKDHTSYGSVLAMYIPFLIGFSFYKNYSILKRRAVLLITFILIAAIIFSYTRAAWLSLTPAFVVWLIIKLKIRFRTLAFIGIIFLALFFVYKNQIFIKLERNKTESSTNMESHLKSMANIRSDASNLERINRWNSAIRMFKEKPMFGWGPGTYMFQYAPFQRSYEKTIISTNTGRAGNAHSEYLGPLAESGVLGTLSIILIIIFTIITALKVINNAEKKEVRFLALMALLGLITYYTHGFLNNFLDTDKASAPFWGFTAMIVALDVYHTRQNTNKKVKKD
ncbi:MAG: O-antigen ligase family protein [Chlorobi bacterium]|nr:O-antigen ligase family protein [Chlorobiota bacterium]